MKLIQYEGDISHYLGSTLECSSRFSLVWCCL